MFSFKVPAVQCGVVFCFDCHRRYRIFEIVAEVMAGECNERCAACVVLSLARCNAATVFVQRCTERLTRSMVSKGFNFLFLKTIDTFEPL